MTKVLNLTSAPEFEFNYYPAGGRTLTFLTNDYQISFFSVDEMKLLQSTELVLKVVIRFNLEGMKKKRIELNAMPPKLHTFINFQRKFNLFRCTYC